MNVLVTDGENRSALAATRSLGRKGCRVIVTGAERGNIAGASFFCNKKQVTSDPLKQGGRYVQEILDIITDERIDVVFPMTEQSISLLNTARKKLPENCFLACAKPEDMEAVSDKYRLFEAAERIGVPIPRTIFINDYDDFLLKRQTINTFPVVVKPALSKRVEGDKVVSASVMYAEDRNALNKLYETKSALRHPSLIQEMIVGKGTGLFTLFDNDRHLALFSHERLAEKPPSGGVSVVSQSVPADPDMVAAAEKLLTAVGWKGVAMVEFKRDARDGKAKLMEINGRFWGSLHLAISAGIDFPALYLDYCVKQKPEKTLKEYCIGYRMVWLLGVIDHLFLRVKKRRTLNSLDLDIPRYHKVILWCLDGFKKNTTYDVFSLSDIKPFKEELKKYFFNFYDSR